jgi:1-acyl-sn-glycerol-3-phosphate acyltransferase
VPAVKRVIDWVFTVPFLLAFGVVLVVFEVVARLVRLFGLRPMEVTMGVMQRMLLWTFRLCGTRLVVERSPHLQPRTGYLIVSNHQSLFDVPIFGGLLFSNYPKYVSKRELGRWIPAVSFNLTHGGNALIDRDDPDQAKAAIWDLAATSQKRNVAVVIFPEGSRSRDGRLRPFRRGGALEMMAAAPDMPVVATTIDGSWELLRHKMLPIPFGTTVRVRFGNPMHREDMEDSVLLKQARADIEATLARWRRAT